MNITEFNNIKDDVVYNRENLNFYLKRNEMSFEEFNEIIQELKRDCYDECYEDDDA